MKTFGDAFILIATMCLLLVGPPGFAQSKGGRWQFENNGLDTAEWDLSDDNGSPFGTATFSSAPPLQQEAFYLWQDPASAHDFFLIEDSDDLDFANEDIGISAWIYPVLLNDVHNLVNKGNQFTSPKTTNYSLRISRSQKLEFLVRDANDQAHRVSSSFGIPVNQWSFVAAFYDFSEKKVYMWNDPGADAADTLDFDQSIVANDEPLAIGAWYRSDSSAASVTDFEGRLDDVRISGRLEDIIPEVITSVESPSAPVIPQQLTLFQNYPNPFNSTTVIRFETREAGEVTLKIYNAIGQLVGTAADGFLQPGNHELALEANDWPSGLYYYRLESKNAATIQKMILVK